MRPPFDTNSFQGSDSSQAAAPPSRFIIKPVDESKEASSTQSDKRFQTTPAEDKENSKPASPTVTMTTQHIPMTTQHVTTQHVTNSSHRVIDEVRHVIPDWFRKDHDYLSLISKHDSEMDDLRSR